MAYEPTWRFQTFRFSTFKETSILKTQVKVSWILKCDGFPCPVIWFSCIFMWFADTRLGYDLSSFCFAAWSSVTWSWRLRWWASTRSWTKRGRSTPWWKSNCATPSAPRKMRSGETRCCRKRWSSFSPRSVTSPRPATTQPLNPADRTATIPSGYSERKPAKTETHLFMDVNAGGT